MMISSTEGVLREMTFETFGLFEVMGYEESDQRGYLTFTCNRGTYVGVLAKKSEEVWFYKFEKRVKIND